jgi:hypothetical protein
MIVPKMTMSASDSVVLVMLNAYSEHTSNDYPASIVENNTVVVVASSRRVRTSESYISEF